MKFAGVCTLILPRDERPSLFRDKKPGQSPARAVFHSALTPTP